MKVYSVDITSWTSSFRYPMLMSGAQLTLEVPPLSTIMGLINAASGKYLLHEGSQIGYYFEYKGKGVDIETIHMAEVNKKGTLLSTRRSNIIKREFLFETFLRLYSPKEELIRCFESPVFQLLLGRSSDLATVDMTSITRRTLQPLKKAEKISGQVVPYGKAALPGRIQPLSKYFTNTIPREMLGKEPYVVINYLAPVEAPFMAYRDSINHRDVDIYMHEVNSATL